MFSVPECSGFIEHPTATFSCEKKKTLVLIRQLYLYLCYTISEYTAATNAYSIFKVCNIFIETTKAELVQELH